MIKVSARLLSPIRPNKNTISGTKSRFSHSLNAYTGRQRMPRLLVCTAYSFQIVVIAHAQKVD